MSLIEATTVLLITSLMAVTAAISYQLFAARADDVSAISVLRVVFIIEQAMYQNLGDFSDDPAVLATSEPSLTFTNGPSAGPEIISVEKEPFTLGVDEGSAVVDAVSLAARQAGTCLVAVVLEPGSSAEPERSGRYTITNAGLPTDVCTAQLAHSYVGVEPWHSMGPY